MQGFNTALLWAVKNENVPAVELLLANNANVEAKRKNVMDGGGSSCWIIRVKLKIDVGIYLCVRLIVMCSNM